MTLIRSGIVNVHAAGMNSEKKTAAFYRNTNKIEKKKNLYAHFHKQKRAISSGTKGMDFIKIHSKNTRREK